jgi:hypothetical protein
MLPLNGLKILGLAFVLLKMSGEVLVAALTTKRACKFAIRPIWILLRHFSLHGRSVFIAYEAWLFLLECVVS